MEIKDWVYSIGIGLTFIIGVANFLLGRENRANAIREHLYKEQFLIFRQLSKKIHTALVLLHSMKNTPVNSVHNIKTYANSITELENLVTEELLLIDNDLLHNIDSVYGKLNDIGNKLSNTNAQLSEEEIKEVADAYVLLFDEIRKHIGVDVLGNENKKLIGK